MSETAINKLGAIGEIIKIHTYVRVREDDISIYGFNTNEELRMFELLLSVSGIGAKSAQKIILELKDKIDMQQSIETALDVGEQSKTDMTQHSSALQADAVSALTALGYSATDALRAVRAVPAAENMTVEELLKQSLKNM